MRAAGREESRTSRLLDSTFLLAAFSGVAYFNGAIIWGRVRSTAVVPEAIASRRTPETLDLMSLGWMPGLYIVAGYFIAHVAFRGLQKLSTTSRWADAMAATARDLWRSDRAACLAAGFIIGFMVDFALCAMIADRTKPKTARIATVNAITFWLTEQDEFVESRVSYGRESDVELVSLDESFVSIRRIGSGDIEVFPTSFVAKIELDTHEIP